MAPTGDDARRPSRLSTGLAGLPTGAKLFLILSIALLPLAMIAFFAVLQTNRVADAEIRSRLRVAAAESSRALAIELIGDMTALRVALNALDVDPADTPSCARAQGVFAQQIAAGARFIIADRNGRSLCGEPMQFNVPISVPVRAGPIGASIVPGQGLALTMTSPSGMIVATALFPRPLLSRIGQPSGFTLPFEQVLLHDDLDLPLRTLSELRPIDRAETMLSPLGIGDLSLRMRVRSAPITSPLVIAMLLPLVMWAAAAGIGWFVVDRLLIRPLRELRARVAAYAPGQEIYAGDTRAIPAQEIRELGETFSAISRTVMLHEAGLAEGLVRQTKLTREVHHRVKNNLQVISSLINFHARGARGPEAASAYASIQRRVDALAVVHRNHFAELEVNRGLSLRSVIGDLASNIRATVADPKAGPSIILDLDSSLVSQDVAIAVAFLITEMIELAMAPEPGAQIRISIKPGDSEHQAVLRISAPSLVDSDQLRVELAERYGRVIEGLSRQLRSKLHYDPLVGAYEIAITITARD